jgi:hypothetical protein
MAPTEHNLSSTGAWANDDLKKTSASQAGVGADAGLPDTVRFVAGVAKLVRSRRASGAAADDVKQPAIFLLSPKFMVGTPLTGTDAATPKRVPRLQAGLEAITGRIWFTPATAVTGTYIPHNFTDLDELFRFVTDDLSLGNVPAVLYNPLEVPATLAFYEFGLLKEEEVQDSLLDQSDITLEKIFEALDVIHRENLITPEVQGKVGQLWENRDKYWPVELAEDTVQLYLKIGLTTAFPTCTIRPEQTQATGRLDLEIEESDFQNPCAVVRHAVLELKVLRSFSSKGTSVSQNKINGWVLSGMKQAAAYRDNRNAKIAALCCFDMRSTDSGESCFDAIATPAATLKVNMRRWYLYSTSAAYRTALISKQLGA